MSLALHHFLKVEAGAALAATHPVPHLRVLSGAQLGSHLRKKSVRIWGN